MEQQATSSRFFDTIDNIDRYFYGRKMKNFILGSICVLAIAPLLDEFLEVPHDRLTYLTTFIFFFYALVIVLAWVSAWRDDTGNWSWKRAQSRLKTYYLALRDTAKETQTNSKDENLYKISTTLFFGGICWKAVQNLSVFIRKPYESLVGSHWIKLRNFEQITKHWCWVSIGAGIAILIYLYNSNPQILERIKRDLTQLFGIKKRNVGFDNVRIDADKLVISSEHSTSHLSTLTVFSEALKSWKPKNCYYEYEFQDNLYRHLKKAMPESQIELEYPIGDAALKNKGRADIVIDDFILIEMKRDSSANAIQRAKGQILQYSDIWRNRGPVILLLCNYDYEHAKLSFTPTMLDLHKLERPVLTIVAQ